jgi:hypothetical protein
MAPVLLFGILPAANEKLVTKYAVLCFKTIHRAHHRCQIIAGLGKIVDYARFHDPETLSTPLTFLRTLPIH